MANLLNLLLIEDSPNDGELLLRHLKKANINPQIERVETLSAVRVALNRREWDAVVCDYNLPAFNAIDAIALVRDINPEVPCIVVSGSVGEERAVETMKAGASDYIMKENLTRLVPVLQREMKEAEVRRERRRAEDNLKKSEENLRQAQKLESIGQLAGGIAHDFNNLLATILLQSEILKEGLDKTHSVERVIEHVEKGIEQIIKSGERATNLTRQLLAFSRKQVIQPRALNINTLIKDMETMFRRVIEESVELKTHLASDLENVKIDPGHLEQILMNLVVNARDAMPTGGKLEIATKNSSIDELTARSCGAHPGPHVLLTVTDSGSGFTEEAKKHLFEPFFTTKPIGKGTGLGLCTVYGIVKQNNGLIFVDSEPDKGTTFRIYFPMTDEKKNVVTLVPTNALKGEGHETILIVEDETDLRDLVERTLSSNGYKVLTAANGLEALEVIKTSTVKVDLVITDVVMPRMGGPELAKQLWKENKEAKFLFQSGYPQDALNQNGLKEDQIHFLAKPYTVKILLEMIRRILN